jgi:hypothetical protein
VPPIQIPTQNEEMKVLFNKFYRLSNSGTKLHILIQSLKFEGPLRIGCNMTHHLSERLKLPKVSHYTLDGIYIIVL